MGVWPKEDNTDITIKIALFLISPVISFFYSLRTVKTKSSYAIFFLAAVFFGLAFTVQSGKTTDFRYDGASYRSKFDRYVNYGETYYYERLAEFIKFEGGDKDFYFDTIAFYTSKVTTNYHVLFAILALIFAYFSLKSFRFLTQEARFISSFSCLLLAALFFENQIFNINGARFWTAAWVGIYSIFQIFKNSNKKYFLLALATPLIHGSYWVFTAVLILAFLNKKNYKIWIYLFFLSFLLSFVSVQLVRSFSSYLPAFLQNMAAAYTDQEYLEELGSRSNAYYFVSEFFSILVKIYVNGMVWLFIRNESQIHANPKTSNLFSFLLVWMTFVNFAAPIPSLGDRFFKLSFPIIAYIWLVNFSGVRYQKYLYLLPFVFLFIIYQQIYLYKGVLDFEFYISSPFYLIYKHLIAL